MASGCLAAKRRWAWAYRTNGMSAVTLHQWCARTLIPFLAAERPLAPSPSSGLLAATPKIQARPRSLPPEQSMNVRPLMHSFFPITSGAVCGAPNEGATCAQNHPVLCQDRPDGDVKGHR